MTTNTNMRRDQKEERERREDMLYAIVSPTRTDVVTKHLMAWNLECAGDTGHVSFDVFICWPIFQ
jgi:hypothetical protein